MGGEGRAGGLLFIFSDIVVLGREPSLVWTNHRGLEELMWWADMDGWIVVARACVSERFRDIPHLLTPALLT